jgi:hypothetical protein
MNQIKENLDYLEKWNFYFERIIKTDLLDENNFKFFLNFEVIKI